MIKSIILVGFWMFLIPIILGFGILKLDKKGNKNICLSLILGLFVELLVFSCLAIPMTFLRCSFTLLKNSWAIIMVILSLFSIVLNRKNIKEIVKQNVDEIKGLPKILTVIFIILLSVQCYYPFKYMHEDYDDSNFVAKAVIAVDTDTLFVYDDAGYEYEEFPTRTVLSQFPHYTGMIASLSDIHPTVLAHTVFPVVFIIITYSFFYVFGKSLFKNDLKKAIIFLNLLAVIYMFGDYSRYTNFVRLLYRTWQGKSLLANLTIPFIWYVFIEYIGKENSKFGWILLGLCCIASITFSSMTLILLPIMVTILMLLYAIKEKEKKYAIVLISIIIVGIVVVFLYLTFGNPIVKNETLNNEELTFIDKIKIFVNEVCAKENINLVKESFDRAGGGKYYFTLFCVSILYILVSTRDGKNDIVYLFAFFSIIFMLINLNPVFSKIWSWIIDDGVHWRLYWLLPIGYTISYMFTDIISTKEKKSNRLMVVILSVCILVINGKLLLTKNNYKEVDNYYKVPDLLLEIIFKIQADDEEYKKVAGLEDVLVYTRQVDGNVYLSQSRRVGGEYSDELLLKIISKGKTKEIYDATLKEQCNYVVINKYVSNFDEPFLNYGFEVLFENEQYVLYKINLEKNKNRRNYGGN